MKKAFITALIVGASALYIVTRTPATVAGAAQQPIATTQSAPAGPSGNEPAPLPTPPPTQPAPAAAPMPGAMQQMPKMMGQYKDGTYTGPSVDAFYGYVQVQATVSGGKLTNVTFLSYPNTHSTSVYINSQAMPMLTQEALSAQSANVNLIGGATDTSLAFKQSLGSALAKAANS